MLYEGLQNKRIVSVIAFESYIKLIIEQDWEKNYPKVFAMILITKGIPTIMLSALMSSPSKTMFQLNIATNALCIAYEAYQMNARKLKTYFKSFHNWIDLAGYSSGLVWNIIALAKFGKCLKELLSEIDGDQALGADDLKDLRAKALSQVLKFMSSVPVHKILIGLNGLFLTYRSTDIFYMFKNTRTLFMILIVSFSDSKAFLIILAYICGMFGATKKLMEMGFPGLNLFEYMLMVFTDAMGGLFIPE